jgi:hypothetical protein
MADSRDKALASGRRIDQAFMRSSDKVGSAVDKFIRNGCTLARQLKVSAWVLAFHRGIPSAFRQARLRSSSRTPAPLSPITSSGPVTGKAATGNPLAMASSRTRRIGHAGKDEYVGAGIVPSCRSAQHQAPVHSQQRTCGPASAPVSWQAIPQASADERAQEPARSLRMQLSLVAVVRLANR